MTYLERITGHSQKVIDRATHIAAIRMARQQREAVERISREPHPHFSESELRALCDWRMGGVYRPTPMGVYLTGKKGIQ
jgi:hypothetical protein